MKIYPGEGPDEQAERKRLGLKLTPYELPRSTEEQRAMAQELLSRYVVPHGVPPLMFGADCIALGIFLGSESKDALAKTEVMLEESRATCARYLTTLVGALQSGCFDKVTHEELRVPGEAVMTKVDKLEKQHENILSVLAACRPSQHQGEGETNSPVILPSLHWSALKSAIGTTPEF